MKPEIRANEVDMGVSEQDAIIGAIWSRHCMNPFKDVVLIGNDLFLINADGTVNTGISCMTIQNFGSEA